MKKFKESKRNKFLSKKSIIAILLIVSLIMTSSTFAYWADVIVGTNTSVTSTFVVGSPRFDDHKFVLDSEVSSYDYLIPLKELLNDSSMVDEVSLGIAWNDIDLLEEYQDKDVEAEINVTYTILIMKNGKEVNSNIYDRYSGYINIDVDEDNPSIISYSSIPSTFEFDVSVNETSYFTSYFLSRYDVYIIVSYEIVEDTIIIK